jgi:type II secretory pathway component PulJ
MIATTILGVIMLAIYSSWSAILRGSRAGLTAASEVQRMRIATRTIEEALWGVMMFAENAAYYSFLVDTNGSQAAISFASHVSESFPRSGRYTNSPVRRVTFAVENSKERVPELVLRQYPILTEADRDEEENPVVLAKDVSLFDLQFWGKDSRDWESAWPYTNQLPKLVKVTLGFGRLGGFSRRPRELSVRIVALPATAVPVDWQRSGGQGGRPGTNQPPLDPRGAAGGRAAPLRGGAQQPTEGK